MKQFSYTKEVASSFSETLDNLDFALLEHGFGILTKIDMQDKLKEKLGKDIEDYMILGACNPALASKALDAEYEIGLLLPCNIIVYSKNAKTYVSTILATKAMGMIENSDVEKVAEKAENLLKKVIDNL